MSHLKDVLFLRVFMLFLQDIRDRTGVNINQIAIRSNFSPKLYYNCKRLVDGKTCFLPTISLQFILHISNFFGVPCDIPAYLKIIVEQDRLKLLSEVPIDDLPT